MRFGHVKGRGDAKIGYFFGQIRAPGLYMYYELQSLMSLKLAIRKVREHNIINVYLKASFNTPEKGVKHKFMIYKTIK